MAEPRFDWRHTGTKRRKFLQALAETYDVEKALAEGKLTWAQVCELRVRHPDFAVRFDEVIDAGYDRLEAMLLRAAGVGEGATPDPAAAQALIKLRRSGREAMSRGAPARGRGGRNARLEPGADDRARVDKVLAKLAPLQAAAAGGAYGGSGGGGGSGVEGAAAGGG